MKTGTRKTLKTVIRLGILATPPPEVVMNPLYLKSLIVNFLNEDLGAAGDITSGALPPIKGRTVTVAKERGVLCGKEVFNAVFKTINPSINLDWKVEDGDEFKEGDILCTVEGDLTSILTGERTALNLIQRLSGIATTTRQYVKELEGSSVRLLDTRKTTPGLRILEKYATRVGGALNHRLGLYDAVMIKDNHIKAFGGVKRAVKSVVERVPVTTKIEVEVENWNQLEEVIEVVDLVDIVMLDNWPLEEIKEGSQELKRVKPDLKVEVSGGVTLEKLKLLKSLPIDYVSTSKIITAAKWLDLSMEVG